MNSNLLPLFMPFDKWNSRDFENWIYNVNKEFEPYMSKFGDLCLDPQKVFELSEESLQILGMTVGHRTQLLDEISKLNQFGCNVSSLSSCNIFEDPVIHREEINETNWELKLKSVVQQPYEFNDTLQNQLKSEQKNWNYVDYQDLNFELNDTLAPTQIEHERNLIGDIDHVINNWTRQSDIFLPSGIEKIIQNFTQRHVWCKKYKSDYVECKSDEIIELIEHGWNINYGGSCRMHYPLKCNQITSWKIQFIHDQKNEKNIKQMKDSYFIGIVHESINSDDFSKLPTVIEMDNNQMDEYNLVYGIESIGRLFTSYKENRETTNINDICCFGFNDEIEMIADMTNTNTNTNTNRRNNKENCFNTLTFYKNGKRMNKNNILFDLKFPNQNILEGFWYPIVSILQDQVQCKIEKNCCRLF